MNSREFLCIALDINDGRKSRRFVQTLKSFASTFKVGLQLFSSTGPSIIERVREEGVSVFVDLKLNDIPNTVSAAVTELAKRGANLLTVHTLAGLDTLKAAKEAALKFSPSPKIIAVTVLTSIDKKALQEIGLEKEPSEMVLCLAAEAAKVGADGVVASAQEASILRRILPRETLIVTPGIRLGESPDDQKRVATPQVALEAGANLLVVGRPIIEDKNPLQSAERFFREITSALEKLKR